jgi:guanosine-3',5'-bis(diphosphate) 3'-pyrophosphohydrolase
MPLEGRDGPAFIAEEPALRQAVRVATRAHAGQTGKDGVSPYINHPIAVATRLHAAGCETSIVTAGLLHDVVERSDLSLGEVVEGFGPEVGELVAALTEDRAIEDYTERKRAHRQQVEEAGAPAAAIYAADKLVNVGDLRLVYADVGEAAAERFEVSLDVRVVLWHGDLAMLARAAPELEIVGELGAELAAFERERTRSFAGQHA